MIRAFSLQWNISTAPSNEFFFNFKRKSSQSIVIETLNFYKILFKKNKIINKKQLRCLHAQQIVTSKRSFMFQNNKQKKNIYKERDSIKLNVILIKYFPELI